MLRFVSEENHAMHLEYINFLRLKLAAFKKMSSESGRVARMIRDEVERERRVANELTLHEVYLNSFSEREFVRSVRAASRFGSESALLTELCKLGIETPYGFIGVFVGIKGEMGVFSASGESGFSFPGEAVLALDVCEHAYFYDYGFNKEKYLRRALSYLSLGRMDVFS